MNPPEGEAVAKPAAPELGEPFTERIERLKHELAQALRWNRPAILLVVYTSEFVRAETEAELTAWLREQGQVVARAEITGPDDPMADVPQILREQPDHERTVFFVSDLRRGAPTTWNALNVRREYLVEDCIRVVFWLTEGEAADLPRYAPDFWAFRHRVVEFLEPPEMSRAVRQAEELAWEGFEERLSPDERRARIAFRERLLAELPDTPETAVARAELHYTLGGLYQWSREYEASLGHLEAALALAEQSGNVQLQAWLLNSLGNVYADLRQYEQAIAAYQRALQTGGLPDKGAKVYNNLGNVYRDLGQYERAIAEYQRAVELDPKDVTPHNSLGNVYRDQGRYEEAIAAYRRAIELAPKDATPHNGLGNVYRDQGRYEEAIAAYQRAIELDPKYDPPHNGLGNVYYQQDRYEEAIAACQRAIELNPNFAGYHDNLGKVYRDLRQHEQAIAAYQRAIELDPNLAAPRNGLGTVYADLGQYEQAIAEYQRAIELDPNLAAPHNGLGNVYYQQGWHEKAIAEYEQAIELDPNETGYHGNLGNVYSALGQPEQAIAEYERAIELDPTRAAPYVGLAGVSRHIGDAERLMRYAAEARQILKPDDHYNLACLESIAGNVDAALAHLAQALEGVPRRRALACRDPDLAFIRDDPRFWELMGHSPDS